MRRWDRLLDQYIVEYEAAGREATTVKGVRRELERWGTWLKNYRPRPTLEAVNVDLITGYVRGRAAYRTKSTLSSVISKLRCMGEFLVRERIWPSNAVQIWMHVRHVSRPSAIVEVAHELDLVSNRDFVWLMRELGQAVDQPTRAAREKSSVKPAQPKWNRDMRELQLGDEVIRRLRGYSVAVNATRVLDSFQELGWPQRIDDPLPGGRDPERLRDTVKSLNQGLTRIRFAADGSGNGITWELL